MSAVLSTPPVSTLRRDPMQVLVEGRIEYSSRFEGKTTSRIISPAADRYSRPAITAVRSKSSLGTAGDEVSVLCRLGGYTRKAFRATDKDTGEVKFVTPVNMTLDAIE